MDINLNSAVCLVEKQNQTETIVTNVCTGEITSVPHGTLDFLFGGLLALLLTAFWGLLMAGGWAFYHDYK